MLALMLLGLGAPSGRGQVAATPASQPLLLLRALGGSAAEQFYHAIELPGQSVLAVGSTRSNDDDLAGRTSLDLDGWLVRHSLRGEVIWQRSYGGPLNDELRAAVALPDGGLLAAGHTERPAEGAADQAPNRDAWVVRTDGLGRLLWQRSYGGRGADAARALLLLPDGGFILAGETNSPDLPGAATRGGTDVWVLRLDARGALLWQRTYGGSLNDGAWAALLQPEGSIVLAGGTASADGEMPPGRGRTDGLLMLLNPDGSLRWRRTFGGSSFDEFYSLVAHAGGYVLAGTTQSRDGDVRGHRGNGDAWLVATDAGGYLRWTQCYGGTGDEGANHISTTRDGGLLVAATARSRDGQRTVFRGVFDGWLLRLDGAGQLRWQRSLGGFQNDAFTCALETQASGRYVAVGHTASSDYDLAETLTHGSLDAWLVHLAEPAEPTRPRPPDEALATLLAGYVTDATTGRRLSADITLVDYATLKPIRHVRTDTASALYQFALTRTEGVGLSVLAAGYLMENRPLRIVPAQLGTLVQQDIALVPIRPDTSLNLHHIFFETGSAKLKTESTLELQKLLQFLRENPSLTVRIIGHTDATAGAASSLQLSRYRALEVKSYLQERGVVAARMEAIGVGSTRPIADEATEAGRARNRRVEIEITAH